MSTHLGKEGSMDVGRIERIAETLRLAAALLTVLERGK